MYVAVPTKVCALGINSPLAILLLYCYIVILFIVVYLFVVTLFCCKEERGKEGKRERRKKKRRKEGRERGRIRIELITGSQVSWADILKFDLDLDLDLGNRRVCI